MEFDQIGLPINCYLIGEPRRQRLNLTPAQRDELERLTVHLGISLQQGYRRLRAGSITLAGR